MDARQQSPELADEIRIKSAAEKLFFPVLMGFGYRFHGEQVMFRILEQQLWGCVCRSDEWEITQGIGLHADSSWIAEPIGLNSQFG